MHNKQLITERINQISSFIILFNALFIGLEANFRNDTFLNRFFDVVDVLFVCYFTIEIFLRIRYFNWNYITTFRAYLFRALFQNKTEERKKSSKLENISGYGFDFFWICFDLIIVSASWVAFGKHFIKHPEIVLILRMLRIFRIFKIFHLSESIQKIERKIIAVIPTISTFLILIFLVIYTYAIIGMNLYEFKQFKSINFTNVYSAMMDLFLSMTNGWAGILKDLHSSNSVSPVISDIYITSFFIFSVMITLNVFLAVMTSGIQDRINEEKEAQHKTKGKTQKAKDHGNFDEKLIQINKQLQQIQEQLNDMKKH